MLPPAPALFLAIATALFKFREYELASPRILVCPSDRGTRANASDWSNAAYGFANAANRNLALSYFTGLDTDEELSVTMVAGDRNIGGGKIDNCQSVSPAPGVKALELTATDTTIRWTNSIHGLLGNSAVCAKGPVKHRWTNRDLLRGNADVFPGQRRRAV